MEQTDTEVTRLTIRPVPQPADDDKDTGRHYYHTMAQFLKAIFIYFSIFAAILIISAIVWGTFVLVTIYILHGAEPILNTIT